MPLAAGTLHERHPKLTAPRIALAPQSPTRDVNIAAEHGALAALGNRQHAHVLRYLAIESGIALAAMSLLSLGVGWLMAGRVLQPLEDSYQAQRQFVANASHELRAPLTRQRALIQVALANPEADLASLRTAHERVLASEQHLEHMIDALLALTRSQAGLERREHLDLAALTSQAMLTRESQLQGLDLDVRVTLATAPTAGDPRLIERLLANLIDNAIRHNTPPDMSRSPPEPATGTRSGQSRTPARPFRPRRSSVCSNPSNDWPAPVPATTTATDWDFPSSKRSPTRTVPSSPRTHDRKAASPSKSHSRPRPQPAPRRSLPPRRNSAARVPLS